MKLASLYSVLVGMLTPFGNKPILVWNLDESKQEESIYNVMGVHWVDELGATVIKVKRRKM